MAILRKLTKAFTRILLKYPIGDRKSTRLNSSHDQISYAVFCLKKKKTENRKKVEPRYRELDLVVAECGIASGFAVGLRLLRPRGTFILQSTFHGATAVYPAYPVFDGIS